MGLKILKRFLYKDRNWYKQRKEQKALKKRTQEEDKIAIEQCYKHFYKKDLDLENPQTLNEKLMWLKLYDRRDFCSYVADKYAVREYWKQFGEDALIPLFFETTNPKDIIAENLPDYPCIVKVNHGCGGHEIIYDKTKVDYKKLQKQLKLALSQNYYLVAQEWNYKNIKPRILVEKLLICKNGKTPNDYKLNYFNGKLEFIYCSIDREGKNYRNIYDKDWNLLPFSWASKIKLEAKSDLTGPHIDKPKSFERMVKIGNEISKNFDYVRVDFYDVDGQLYYGEVTLCHGAGTDMFRPQKYDLILGKKLKLTVKKECK